MPPTLQQETVLRANDAIYSVDQANTIYGLVFIVFAEFGGFQSEKWRYKLEAQIRVSGLVDQLDPDEDDLIGAAIFAKSLPRETSLSTEASLSLTSAM